MRHRKQKNKLRGSTTERRAMYANMLTSLVEHGRVKTTLRRAKALRSIAERTVTRATSLGDLLLKDRSKLEQQDKARLVHAMRMVRRRLRDPRVVVELFDNVAPRYLGRPGGYTRIYKLGTRKGDCAPMALVEFVEAEMPEKEGGPQGTEAKKSRFGWLTGKKEQKEE